MKKFTDREILNMSMIYTPRVADIICADPHDLKQLPTKRDLRRAVATANELYDFDTLSILNEKYDLSILDNKDNEMDYVAPEAIKQVETEFVSFMKKIDKSFKMPEFNKKWEIELCYRLG